MLPALLVFSSPFQAIVTSHDNPCHLVISTASINTSPHDL